MLCSSAALAAHQVEDSAAGRVEETVAVVVVVEISRRNAVEAVVVGTAGEEGGYLEICGCYCCSGCRCLTGGVGGCCWTGRGRERRGGWWMVVLLLVKAVR